MEEVRVLVSISRGVNGNSFGFLRAASSSTAISKSLWDLGRGKINKGIHPRMQWISYVTRSGRLTNVMMTKIHQVGKVYHFRAKRQMAQGIGQIAEFKRRYGQKEEGGEEK